MNYFKHTNGEAFTINSSDYVGFFTIVNGKPFTDKSYTENSIELTPKNNIITKLFTEKYNFNTTHAFIDKLTSYYSNSFDVLDKNNLDSLANKIDTNNILCFKNLILGNPTVYKFEENNGFYYGLSGVEESNPKTIPAKVNYRGSCESFAAIKDWLPLDDAISSIVKVDRFENFIYICTTGEITYTFSGSFSDPSIPLTLEDKYLNIDLFNIAAKGYTNPDYVYNIYQDFENNKILYVKIDTIEIHDAATFNECPVTTLIDIIPLKKGRSGILKWNTKIDFNDPSPKWGFKYFIDNPNNPDFIKFGYNYRTEIDKLGEVLTIKNKYSQDTVCIISLKDYCIFNVRDIDIHPINDYIIILHTSHAGEMILSQFDPIDVSTMASQKLESLNLSAIKHKIEFSNYDSDIFIYSNEQEYHTRYLSKPEYPAGRLETCDLMYGRKKWNTTVELWDYSRYTWNNELNNSNRYYNRTSTSILQNNKMYMILHNIGRIYAISQPMNDRFYTFIPMDIVKSFQSVECSESSIGLQLNIILRNLVEDTFAILRNSTNTFLIEERKVRLKQLADYSQIIENMYIHGNESLNVLTMQRILFNILELQKNILPKTNYIPNEPIINV